MDNAAAEFEHAHIGELVRTLHSRMGYDGMLSWLQAQLYIAKDPFKTTRPQQCVLIKYLEHNRSWRAPWQRQARGCVVTIDGYVLKSTLPRSAEVFTLMHMQRGVSSTQDISNCSAEATTFAHLDDDQQTTMRQLMAGGDLDRTYLSFKRDGSQVSLGWFPNGSRGARLVRDLLARDAQLETDVSAEQHLAHMVMEESTALGGVALLATQGTMGILSTSMLTYVLTSLLCSRGMSPRELHGMNTRTAVEAARPHVRALLQQAVALHPTLCSSPEEAAQPAWFTFEAICARRHDALADVVHHELTVSYPDAAFSFLAATVGVGDTAGRLIPHYECACAAEWLPPPHFEVRTVAALEELMNDLDDALRAGEHKFWERHTPGTALASWESWPLDHEGFVLYRHCSSGVVCSKVKTPLYYACHKLRPENLPTLLALPVAADAVFPTLASARMVFGDIAQNLGAFLKLLLDRTLCAEQRAALTAGMPAKALASLERGNAAVILANTSPAWNDLAHALFCGHFPTLVPPEQRALRKLFTTVRAWEDATAVQDRVRVLCDRYDPLVMALFPSVQQTLQPNCQK